MTSWAALRYRDECYHADDILTLVQGIYEHTPTMARAILRSRIFTSADFSPFEHGVVKIAAKRVTFSAPDKIFAELSNGARTIAVSPTQKLSLAELAPPSRICLSEHSSRLDYLETLVLPRDPGKPNYRQHRSVVAGIFDDVTGELIAVAHNENAVYRTWHAELRLVSALWPDFSKPSPWKITWRFYATLQPCIMCAGALDRLLPDEQVVYFRHPDPGQAAKRLGGPPLRFSCVKS
jgi:tRNA(Arg) A34 adenosine deaminase TadA